MTQELDDKKVKFTTEGRPVSDNPENKLYIVTSDTDGVLAQWAPTILKIVNKMDGGKRTPDQWVNWSPWEQDPPLMTKKQFEEAFQISLNTKEFYLNLPAYDNVDFKAISEDLDHCFYNLYVVTHRANLVGKDDGIKDTTQQLKRWVSKMGIPNVTGCIAGIQNRPHLLEQLQADFHLDDYFVEYERIEKYGKTKCYLMDRPHNRQYDVGDRRVFSFNEFLTKTVFNKTMEARAI